jgi:hypothetical protein
MTDNMKRALRIDAARKREQLTRLLVYGMLALALTATFAVLQPNFPPLMVGSMVSAATSPAHNTAPCEETAPVVPDVAPAEVAPKVKARKHLRRLHHRAAQRDNTALVTCPCECRTETVERTAPLSGSQK